MIERILAFLAFSFPALALACGGLFCNSTMPVNQAAERILFAADGDTIHMHVRLTYQGPPSEFGWLLPVPRDVETALSSEQLFLDLDANYAPVFILTTFVPEECAAMPFPNEGGGGGGGGGGGEGALPWGASRAAGLMTWPMRGAVPGAGAGAGAGA